MRWKNILMIAVLVAIFVAAIVFLVLGVTTHNEPTFRDDAIEWRASDFPLRTCGHDRRAPRIDPDALAALQHAINVTDARLGFTALVYVEGDPCAVLVTFGEPAEPGDDPAGRAEWEPGAHFCNVKMFNEHGEALGEGVQHELGHCLGLAHDDYSESIMYPQITLVPDGELPPWISDADRAALRERYAR